MRKKRLFGIITDEEWNNAILFVLKELDSKTIDDIKKIMNEEKELWSYKHHHGLGTYIRNLLRKGGFEWGDIELDTYWVELLEEVMKRVK